MEASLYEIRKKCTIFCIIYRKFFDVNEFSRKNWLKMLNCAKLSYNLYAFLTLESSYF